MKQIKNTLLIFMATVFVMAGILGSVTAKAAVVAKCPIINYVGIEHSPLVVGDTETLTVNSAKYEGLVQYRAFLFDGKKWRELSTGYGAAVDSKTPFVLPTTPRMSLGKKSISVWVKKANTNGITKKGYDSYYAVALNCVSNITSLRVYTSQAANVNVSGLTVKFNGIAGIGGITEPYLYKLFAMNTATGAWSNGASEYAATPSMTFKTAGTYMIIAHVNRGNGILGFQGYKTVKVTVTADATATVFYTTVKAISFLASVNVTMTADGINNFPAATQYQIFDGSNKLSAITPLGTDTTIPVGKVGLGYVVSVQLLDADNNLIKTVNVVLGQLGIM